MIGPIGIKSYIDVMTPFINRKYPTIHIIEIDNDHIVTNAIDVGYYNLIIQPIYAKEVRHYHNRSDMLYVELIIMIIELVIQLLFNSIMTSVQSSMIYAYITLIYDLCLHHTHL